jgi:putative DNA primase/helicase
MSKRVTVIRGKNHHVPEGSYYAGREHHCGSCGPDSHFPESPLHNPMENIGLPIERNLELYRQRLLDKPELIDVARRIVELGEDLACWCALDQPCHVDVILELVQNTNGDPKAADSRKEETMQESPPKDTSTRLDGPGPILTGDHREFLAAHAIDPDLVQDHVRSVVKAEDLPADRDATWPGYVPTLLYRWKMGERETVQIRIPDKKRTGDGPKYLFPKGAEPPLNCVRDDGGPILLVEGTNQHLAAASNADGRFAVYGMSGCWGWAKADPSFMADRTVYVVFDADLKNNRQVWNAASELKLTAKSVKAEVRFVDVPGPGKDGLDDFLAKITDPAKRRDAMASLLHDASHDLPRAPAKDRKKGPASPTFFDDNGILALNVAKAIEAKFPLAISAEDKVAVYDSGVYRTHRLALVTALTQLLGNDYRRGYYGTVEDVILGMLQVDGVRLPDHIDRPWMNTLDGMVDLDTGDLHPWDPALLLAVQFPVHYDPAATCPEFDRWAKEIIGEQLDDLLEISSQMLDPTMTPTKALLLFGPSKSGKSTYLRLLEAIAGKENTSGVDLHELTEEKFARAHLYGKVLNVAADLSARHVQDLKWFKLMTGEDLVRGDRKFGNDFFFHSQALFAFSANELPTVGESSEAYVTRMKPFEFGNSYAGKEDPAVEQAMMRELPGILNRLVNAYRARKKRGHWMKTDPGTQEKFEQASNRVRMWFAEEMTVVTEVGDKAVVPGMTMSANACKTGAQLTVMFNTWLADNGSKSKMGKSKIMQRVAQIPGVYEVRLNGQTRAFNVTERTDEASADPISPKSAESTPDSDPSGRNDSGTQNASRGEKSKTAPDSADFADGSPSACPRCGGVVMPGPDDRLFCAAAGRCQWKEARP